MRCFDVKMQNDLEWVSDGSIHASAMILAEDFIAATMRAHELIEAFRSRIAEVGQGTQFTRDLDGLRIREIKETCSAVVDGVGNYNASFSSDSIEKAVSKLCANIEKMKREDE